MTTERADLGFGEALDNLDEFAPQSKVSTDTDQAAAAAGFKSREPKVPQARRRGRRTGRNAQFNLKSTPETIKAYCEIADDNGWGLGETLEKAVALLQREYGNNS